MEPQVTEAMRMMEEWDREIEQRCAVVAREKGFPSWAEYEKHFREECKQAHIDYERRTDEKCALLGKTREELDMEDPQRFIPDGDSAAECDCEDHSIPFFCPKLLVNYQSQDAPELMDYLARQKRLPMEDLRIGSEDKSRRLDQAMLEKTWVMGSQHDLQDVPFWAKADPVVRQILNSRSPSPPVQLRHSVNPFLSPISPRSSDLTMVGSETTIATAYDSPMSKDEIHLVQTPSSKSSPRSHLPNIQTKPQKYSRVVYSLNPRRKRNSQMKATPPSRKKMHNTATKIRKNMQKRPAMGTRSRNINYFYELGLNGVEIGQSESSR